MKTQKMSLANIKGKLSRTEMKNIMAGSGGVCTITTSGPNYSNPQTRTIVFSNGNASTGANNYCVNLIATSGNGVYHCGYSC